MVGYVIGRDWRAVLRGLPRRNMSATAGSDRDPYALIRDARRARRPGAYETVPEPAGELSPSYFA